MSTDTAVVTGSSRAPDGGWGWIVCLACFFSHVLTDGIFYSFGIMFVELLDYFKESKGKTAIIASLAPSLCYLSGPFVAVLVNKFGCRTVAIAGGLISSVSYLVSVFATSIPYLYVTIGLMTGAGFGLVYLPSIVAVSQYFEKKQAFATGLGVSGAGVGTFIFSPVTTFLIKTYTWKGAFLIQAGLLLNLIVCGLVFRPIQLPEGDEDKPKTTDDDSVQFDQHQLENIQHASGTDKYNDTTDIHETEPMLSNNENKNIPPQKNHFNDENTCRSTSFKEPDNTLEKEASDSCAAFNWRIFTSVPFCLFSVSTFFYSLGYFIPYVYLPATARDAGLGSVEASWLISSIGITNTIGRVMFGFLSDLKCINRLILYNTALVICGAATSFGPFLTTFSTLLLYTVIFGIFSGVTISLTSVILTDLVGIRSLANAFGVNSFFAGIATFAGPPLAGWLYDVSGDYIVSYVGAGLSIAFSGAILYFIPLLKTPDEVTAPAIRA